MSLSVDTNLNAQKGSCFFCNKTPETLKKCSRCSSALYCGKECQVQHWPAHKKVCQKERETELGRVAAPIISPQTATQRLEAYFQSIRWNVSDLYQNQTWPKIAERKKDEKPYLRFSRLTPWDVVFDLGAGSGKDTRELLKIGCKVVAIDFFKGFTQYMQQLQLQYKEKLQVIEEPLSADLLPSDASVSLILALDVLTYCDPKSIIPLMRAIHKTLKEGGQLIASFQNLSEASSFQKSIVQSVGGWGIFNMQMMQDCLQELGFLTAQVIQHLNDPRVLFFCTKNLS